MKLTKLNESPDQITESAGIVRFAIAYPYFMIVACLMVGILGTLALTLLPKDLLPAANQPSVQIVSFYPGMPVDNVAMDLTSRFERYTGQAIGMARQDSKSLSGVSIVRNFFGPDVDLNSAMSQTTSLVMSVLRKLPPGTQPPLILPFDPTATVPLALVAVSGDFPEKVLVDAARYDVGNGIQAIPGAMAPTVMGGADREALVYLDPKKLEEYNFSPLDVLNTITQLNSFIPTGDIKIGKIDYQILSNGLADRIADMNQYPVRSQNGVTVTLKDLGQAKDAHAIQTNVVMVDGKEQVYVPVFRQPGANSIQVVDQVRAAMKLLEDRLNGIKLHVVADQSVFIRHAIESITEEAVIGGGLAALMVLFFLGNPRATFGILLSIPLSLLFAFIGLKSLHQSINAMTLGGLALSIGVLVDNSIVVLENISKKRQRGLDGLRSAMEGASEVAMPVLASTLSTLVVLFPIVFLTGISKVLFSALALSVTFAMIGSYFVAMTVIPLFAATFLKGKMPETKDLIAPFRIAQELMEGLANRYARALHWVANHASLLIAFTFALLVMGGFLAPHIGTELFPRADAGNFVLKTRLASGTRIEETEKFALEINDKLRQWIPPSDLAMIITNAGVRYGFPAAFTPNTGTQDAFFNIELTGDRKHTTQYYAKIIRQEMAKDFPDVEISMELGGLLTSALNGGLASPIDIQIEGTDVLKSHAIAMQLLPKIRALKGAADVRIQQRVDNPELYLDVNREKAGQLGLTVDEVMKNVVSSVSGSSSFKPAIWVDPKSGIDYVFGVQTPENLVSSLDDLKNIPLTGPKQDRSIPLSRVAEIHQTVGSSEINHVNLVPVVDIYLDGQDRDVGGLSGDVQKILDQTQFPKGYRVEIRGEIREMNSAVSSLKWGFLLAAVLVYLILVVQFKSFKIPAIVMATVPVGVVGIITMLFLTNTYFSIQAAIGAIFMIGIAVANGVLLIEFIIHTVHEHGQGSEATKLSAIVDASKLRLRPIMMTSLASMLGLVPMAIGLGHGSEANIPLGRAVIGGQLLSTFLTLFLVPTLFNLWVKAKSASSHSVSEGVPS
jgi:multidrug efflux pump subunit AcrB